MGLGLGIELGNGTECRAPLAPSARALKSVTGAAAPPEEKMKGEEDYTYRQALML